MFFRKKPPSIKNISPQELADSLMTSAKMFHMLVADSDQNTNSDTFRDGISFITEEEERLAGDFSPYARQHALFSAYRLLDTVYEKRNELLPNNESLHKKLYIAKSYMLHLIPSFNENGIVEETKLCQVDDQVLTAMIARCGDADLADMIKTAVASNTLLESAQNVAAVAA